MSRPTPSYLKAARRTADKYISATGQPKAAGDSQPPQILILARFISGCPPSAQPHAGVTRNQAFHALSELAGMETPALLEKLRNDH